MTERNRSRPQADALINAPFDGYDDGRAARGRVIGVTVLRRRIRNLAQ